MFIHQRKHSLFSMKWKPPFLEKPGILCLANGKNVRKCELSAVLCILQVVPDPGSGSTQNPVYSHPEERESWNSSRHTSSE